MASTSNSNTATYTAPVLNGPCNSKSSDKFHTFKTVLHTDNLLNLQSNIFTNQKNALSTSGFKNHELMKSLEYFDKNNTSLQLDNNLSSAQIDVDFTKIHKNNPITVSLKLFLSKETRPESIAKYVDVFLNLYINSMEKANYASRSECEDKVRESRSNSGSSNKSNSLNESGIEQDCVNVDTLLPSLAPEMSPEELKKKSKHNNKVPCPKFQIDMLIISLSKDVNNYEDIENYIRVHITRKILLLTKKFIISLL